MTPVAASVVGHAMVVRDDAAVVPWRDVRLDRFASTATRMVVRAVSRAWPARDLESPDTVGVYLATGETGLDVEAFLAAAHVAWDDAPDDPDFGRMGGRALRAIDPYFSLRTLANGPPALLATHLGARGPSVNVAQQPCGLAWALLAGLDDLRRGRCDVAVVGACDVPSVPTRQAVGRESRGVGAADEAGVLILRRTEGHRPAWSVRWDGGMGADVESGRPAEGTVSDPLRRLLRRWDECGDGGSSFEVSMDAGGGDRAVVVVEAG